VETEPWFVLLVLQRARAWDDDSAMAFDELLAQITRAGVSSLALAVVVGTQ
jgi:hypothetical protein